MSAKHQLKLSYLFSAACALLQENGWTLERVTVYNVVIYKKGDCTLAVDAFWLSNVALSPFWMSRVALSLPPTTYHIRMYTTGIDVPDPQTDGYSYMNATQFAAWVGQTPNL